jgi:Flp pilus assembly protein TadG
MRDYRQLRGDRGSELVEFAFAVTVLLSLVFGIIGFAQAAYAYHFVSHAAREATRYASVRGLTCSPLLTNCPATDTEIQTYVQNLAPLGINASKLTVNATWPATEGCPPGPSNAAGCPVQVSVQYAFTYLQFLQLPTLNISSTSEMVISE